MLDSHLDTHAEAIFECAKCAQNFESAVMLRQHKRKMHSTVSHPRRHGALRALSEKCALCDEHLYSVQARALHLRYHSTDTHKCDGCRAGFPTELALALHMKSHVDEGPFKCEQCDSVLKSRQSLRNHRRQHGELTHTCAHCPKKYSQRVLLLWHQRRQHKELYAHQCTLCPFNSVDAEGLQSHLSQLHRLKCGTCKADFDDEGLLLMHQMNEKHEGIERVKGVRRVSSRAPLTAPPTLEELTCHQCERTFKTRASITLHMKAHLRSRKPKHKTKLSAAKIEGLCKMQQRASNQTLSTDIKHCDASVSDRRKKRLREISLNTTILPGSPITSQDVNNGDAYPIDDTSFTIDIRRTSTTSVERNAKESLLMQVDNPSAQQTNGIVIEEAKKEESIGVPCLQCTYVAVGPFEVQAHMKAVHKFNSRSL